MDSPKRHDVSAAGSIVSELSAADQQRLAELLDQYLASLENEIPTDVDTLLANAPDLKEPFQAYLGQLDALHALAAVRHQLGGLGFPPIRRVIGATLHASVCDTGSTSDTILNMMFLC